MGQNMASKPATRISEQQSSLKDRANISEAREINFSAAQSAIDDLGKKFVNRLPEELQRIEAALSALEDKPDDQSRRTVLFRLVHDLKGEAGTFDYRLITIIGNDLCRFLEMQVAWTPRLMKVVRFYVEAINRVAEDRITGDGDEFGLQMIETLQRMTQKVLLE